MHLKPDDGPNGEAGEEGENPQGRRKAPRGKRARIES
jgi:hypothetical protein